jgi:uncharacterized Zn-binding protein involved in type VI secretion
MTLPAARAGDLHACPQMAPAPHVGGVVAPPASPDVQIGGQLAARLADMTPCAAGGPNSISIGSPMVWVNKLLAARMTDATAHGGTVALGCPTVLIGQGPPGVTMMAV